MNQCLTRWRGRTAAAVMLPLLAAAPLATPTAAATGHQKVIIVLDSSGSMAGKVHGRRKIDIARGVIRDLLKSWSPRIDLGLIAYGHRRKGSCSDIQTIYKVGKADPRRVMAAVNRLRPRGKTPLGAAVLRAAKALKYTEEKATVILVSDGRENCGVDPCKLGRALKKNGVDFTAHVIGFNLKRGADKGLRCLAANTGGRYFAANNAEQLAAALRETVKQVEKAPPPKPAPAKPKPVVVKYNVALTATYSKGGKRITSKKLRWDLYRVIRVKGAPGIKATVKFEYLGTNWRGYGPEPTWKLRPGEYKVHLWLGNAGADARFTVAAGKIVHRVVNLDAGSYTLSATYSKGGKRITSKDLRWDLYRVVKVKGELGSKPKVKLQYLGTNARGYGPEPIWLLNAGEYVVKFWLGHAGHEIRITVKAGAEGEKVANLDAGGLKLTAVDPDTGAALDLKKLVWDVSRVVKVKGELGSKPKVKLQYLGTNARGYGPAPTWLLNAGEYELTLFLGKKVVRKRVIVKAGDTNSFTVPFRK